MIPLLLALASTVASNEGTEADKKAAYNADVNASEYNYGQNEWAKKNSNSQIDQQRRAALARALKASSNELPRQLNQEMYPEIRKQKINPSNWLGVAGAAQAAQGINWNKLFGNGSDGSDIGAGVGTAIND